MRTRRRRRSNPTFFSSSTATEEDVTAWLMEATDVALDGDGEAPGKDNVAEEAADRTAGANGLFKNLVVATDKEGGGDGYYQAKAAAG